MLDTVSQPAFTHPADDAPPMVTLRAADYVALLVQASVTDPTLWPPEMQKGAAAAARVRQTEADCVAQHGTYDWGFLPQAVQDKYDRLGARLDDLQDTGERVSLTELTA